MQYIPNCPLRPTLDNLCNMNLPFTHKADKSTHNSVLPKIGRKGRQQELTKAWNPQALSAKNGQNFRWISHTTHTSFPLGCNDDDGDNNNNDRKEQWWLIGAIWDFIKDGTDNHNNDNDNIQRRNSWFSPSKLTPTCALHGHDANKRKSCAPHWALIKCNLSSVTRYEGTAQLLILTELKSQLISFQ